jgi:hypothetical protein
MLDPSAAVIGGATVEITNLDTGFTRETTTGESGAYNLVGLPVGRYVLMASAGYLRSVRSISSTRATIPTTPVFRYR